MSLMRRVSLFIPEDQLAGLDALKEAHGTPVAESVRRAIGVYLAEKGVKATQKAGRPPPKRK